MYAAIHHSLNSILLKKFLLFKYYFRWNQFSKDPTNKLGGRRGMSHGPMSPTWWYYCTIYQFYMELYNIYVNICVCVLYMVGVGVFSHCIVHNRFLYPISFQREDKFRFEMLNYNIIHNVKCLTSLKFRKSCVKVIMELTVLIKIK